MLKAFLPSSKRSLSTDSIPVEIDIKSSESMPALAVAGRQPGKENRHERGKSASMVLANNDERRDGSTALNGPPPKTEKAREKAAKPAGSVDREKLLETTAVHEAFERLLDDMQIPGTIRPRLATLEPPVKAAMLRSSQTMNLIAAISPPPPRTLRKARSTASISAQLSGPTRMSPAMDLPVVPTTPSRNSFDGSFSPGSPYMLVGAGNKSSGREVAKRPGSADMARTVSFANLAELKDASTWPATSRNGKGRNHTKEKPTAISPGAFAAMLAETRSTALDVEKVKKLRLLLRNEAATWTEDFLFHGGYVALLARLKELLEVEWREEQHDDQVLHELLRCFKALSTSAIGCFALRSSCPTPFAELIKLTYSDKKPGDLCTRQMIVDLLLILMELYPIRASGQGRIQHQAGGAPHTPVHGPASSRRATSIFPLPAPHDTLFSLMRTLLLTPAPSPSEVVTAPLTPHAFIASLHVPRVFKPYLAELCDICRDYFWVFCHSHNSIWALEEVDDSLVEKPRAPGGMTGGVEFEAMGYLTSHVRFLNAVAKLALDLNLPSTAELSAYRLHSDLFASGLERILMTIRKASATYYPTLHLEIARYIGLCIQAQYELPWSVSRLIGSPPSGLRKPGFSTPGSAGGRSPARRSGGARAPMLPATPRLDALKI